jgi:SAM-dependent methyltransferase
MDKYRKLYNEHPDYEVLRERKGAIYEKYINDVKFWKLKFLEDLLNKQNIIHELTNVLEIGCATGELLNLFLEKTSISKLGLDISDRNIQSAKKFYPQITFSSESYLDFFSRYMKEIDVVILSDILEHVEDDLKMLKISGKKSKYVLLNLPIEKVPEYENRSYGINDAEGHLRSYSIVDAFGLIEKAELKVLDYRIEQYVLQAVFKNYLLDKLKMKCDNLNEALYYYIKEINEIEMNKSSYKMNFFALLARK